MAKFQEKINKLKGTLFRWGSWGKILLLFGATQLGGCKKEAPEPPKPQKAVVAVRPRPVVNNAVNNSIYVVDTLDTPRNGTLLFCSRTSIVRYFVENNNSYRMRLYLFVHEQKHKDNYLKGLRSVKVSPAQYAKICMHDEISANIAALLTLRYEYLMADDKESVIKKYENSEYDYYFRALKAKKIFPEKEDKASRDAEWSFIMNETRDMWMRRYAPIYQPAVIRMVERYTRRMDDKISKKMQDKYYRKGIEIAYDIGGVDFSKYMDNDIEPQDKNFSMLDQVVSLKIFKNKQDEHFKTVQQQIATLRKENFPITYELVAQIYFAEGVKSALSGISSEELEKKPEIVSVYYNKINKAFSANADFHKLVWSEAGNDSYLYAPLKNPDAKMSRQVYGKIYAFKGLDLSKMISCLPKNIYNPSIWEEFDFSAKGREFAAVLMLDYQLEQMRKNSKKTSPQDQPAVQRQDKSRKSGQQVITLPDFTQPILVASTPEDFQAIKTCIDDFYRIPEVMRNCDLKAQKKFLRKQKQQSKAAKKTMLLRKKKSHGR